ncbi:hypothetical protein L917_08118 [Phytophthora nicotianae]|uniref:Uncharacterized protein n=1 Tax=Phytophthora nicotianae TaxID=4792 RepID=W2L8R8_PHYNI|nr:hypothetical protein L917_08118 [Phytophthora nicotianae]
MSGFRARFNVTKKQLEPKADGAVVYRLFACDYWEKHARKAGTTRSYRMSYAYKYRTSQCVKSKCSKLNTPWTEGSPEASSPATSSASDAENDGKDPYAAVNLIRATLMVTERPPLPFPRERRIYKHFNPEMLVDTETLFAMWKLIDRQEELTYVSYLVE